MTQLQELSKTVPYQWRVQAFSKNKPAASCVAYIDSRGVMNVLDDVVGRENWQSDYKEVCGSVYAGIGININGEWVWKWDCGSESSIEKEKGVASDSFKRAAVKWGIGRFLYEMPARFVKTNKVNDGKGSCYVIDENGNQVYDLTKYINGKNNSRN